MDLSRRTLIASSFAGLAGIALPSPASSQAGWPKGKVITYVVPYPPGGTTDVLARLLVQKIAPGLQASIIVENKPGATGVIGGDFVAKAAADGFTLLGSSIGPMAILTSLNPNMPYHPVDSFEPVIMIGTIPSVLIVAGDSPYRSVGDLITAAKAKPGQLSFASGGTGTILHMSGELLKLKAGIDLIHVPYKGDTPAIQDVMGGHATMMFAPITPVLAHIQSGKLRALAVAATQRVPGLPHVPTTAEAGLKDAEAEQWQAIFAPKGTPKAITERLNAEIASALRDPEIASKLEALGVTARGGTPADLQAFQRADIAKWADVIRTAKITIN